MFCHVPTVRQIFSENSPIVFKLSQNILNPAQNRDWKFLLKLYIYLFTFIKEKKKESNKEVLTIYVTKHDK